MNLFIFKSVKQSRNGYLATSELFNNIADSPLTLEVIKTIQEVREKAAREGTDCSEQVAELKKRLPVICWQASFADNQRHDMSAVPSGLYMIDIDHPTPQEHAEIKKRAFELRKAWRIVYIGSTPSDGLRIVAECLPQYDTIPDIQSALAQALGCQLDEACKDWARCSFMVHSSMIHYMDYSIFAREPMCVYENKGYRYEAPDTTNTPKAPAKRAKKASQTDEPAKADSGQTHYKGLPLEEVCMEWLRQSREGVPVDGNRNSQLFALALQLRHIVDFNEATMLRVMPRFGLAESEMRTIVHHALVFARPRELPEAMVQVIERMGKSKALGESVENEEIKFKDINNTSKTPDLPPVFKEWYEAAPDDFKLPSVIIQLPILGALGSRLRARYIDGQLHSPSFQVSLEAPQASGKSFMTKIADYDLAQMKEHDEAEREKEREYQEKVRQLKITNTKASKKDIEEKLGSKPCGVIRYVPATMSITQMLIRTNNAQGLHLFAVATEIDTVTKAFKRGISALSDALRCAFDNAEYGQDYASENSFSGIVNLYYNCLFSGTPKAMRRFYPDVEDGLVSRVTFCTLPDQFGKPIPKWKEFTDAQKQAVDIALVRLNEITIQGDEVQPLHEMEMGWCAKSMEQWCVAQQRMAVDTNDRTRDTFCRRSAVVGFRAAMLAYYLWEEQDNADTRKKVCAFARWIANLMLKQQMARFDVSNVVTNVVPFKEAFEKLPSDFTAQQVDEVLKKESYDTRRSAIISKWLSVGLIKKVKNKMYQKIES